MLKIENVTFDTQKLRKTDLQKNTETNKKIQQNDSKKMHGFDNLHID